MEKHRPALRMGISTITLEQFRCITENTYHGRLPEYQDSETLPTPAMWTRALTRHTYNSIETFHQ